MIFRDDIYSPVKKIVIKLGSLSVTNDDGGVSLIKIRRVVKGIVKLKSLGVTPIIVSSGGINAGRPLYKKRSKDISCLQACSSIGWPILMKIYQEEFGKHGIIVSQILLTHDDLKNRVRYLNTLNCMNRLLEAGVLPIVNENDTVSFEEITVGDNDQLSVMISELMDVDLLLILSKTNGLYNQDPHLKGAVKIDRVDYKDKLKNVKTFSKSTVGRGGMASKLDAMKRLCSIGKFGVVATYDTTNPVVDALFKKGGTIFFPAQTVSSSKRLNRIAAIHKNRCFVVVDKGAFTAVKKNASLLPVGIIEIKGVFKRGDSIGIKFNGEIVAVGLTEYSSNDVIKIMQKKSSEVKAILINATSSVVIHRDNIHFK